jgi:hypothetical protein
MDFCILLLVQEYTCVYVCVCECTEIGPVKRPVTVPGKLVQESHTLGDPVMVVSGIYPVIGPVMARPGLYPVIGPCD